MISKNVIKQIHSLEQRKFRKTEGKFVAEGNKLVEDNLSAMRCHRLVATTQWWEQHDYAHSLAEECFEVTREEMEKTSLLQTPQDVLAVFYIPEHAPFTPSPDELTSSLQGSSGYHGCNCPRARPLS